MKSAKLKQLVQKYLLPYLPEFSFQRRLLIMGSVRPLLRAVSFGSSAFSANDISVSTIVIPLYVPTRFINLTFSIRLNETNRWWEYDENAEEAIMSEMLLAIQTRAIPFLQSFDSALHFAERAKSIKTSSYVRNVLQAVAFSFAYAGRWTCALGAIDELHSSIRSLDSASNWSERLLKQSDDLRHAILTSHDAARQMLEQWIDFSVNALHLDDKAKARH